MADDADVMDRMYHLTRHIYDATRKYYLLGRDALIENLEARDGECVIEIGCGTARNLIKMKRTYPGARFYGLDASEEMLKTAHGNLDRAGFRDIKIAQGLAQDFDPRRLFGLEAPPDKLVFSYALSIIPAWREALDHALECLKPGGEIHIVDFGGQEGLSAFFRALLFRWLALFHVYHKPEILDHLRRLADEKRGLLTYTSLYKGYAYRAIFRKL